MTKQSGRSIKREGSAKAHPLHISELSMSKDLSKKDGHMTMVHNDLNDRSFVNSDSQQSN
jgi:hypothetical protein